MATVGTRGACFEERDVAHEKLRSSDPRELAGGEVPGSRATRPPMGPVTTTGYRHKRSLGRHLGIGSKLLAGGISVEKFLRGDLIRQASQLLGRDWP
jgi:hypothetical protein